MITAKKIKSFEADKELQKKLKELSEKFEKQDIAMNDSDIIRLAIVRLHRKEILNGKQVAQ